MSRKFIIWHDRDFDFALWVHKNSILKNFEVTLKAIPKTYSVNDLLTSFKSKEDFKIMPVIQFAGHDVIVQEILENESKILLASEFMTQTPQHDHVAQRFERIYKSSSLGVPSAFIYPKNKIKLEKNKKTNTYKPSNYSSSSIPLSIYVKTNELFENPSLMFYWPTEDGYLLFDKNHPTAPLNKHEVNDWFHFLNQLILGYDNDLTSVKQQKKMKVELGDFNFDESKQVRLSEHLSEDIPEYLQIPESNFPESFFNYDKTYIYSFSSKSWRTDPYMGWACGYKRLFCEGNDGNKIANFVYMPIKTEEVKKDFYNLDELCKECPFDNFNIFENYNYADLVKHIKSEKCISTKAKDLRILSRVADLLVLKEGYIFIND